MIGLDYDKLDEMNNTNSELEKFVPQNCFVFVV